MAKLFKLIKLQFATMSKVLGHSAPVSLCSVAVLLTMFISNRWKLLSPTPLSSWSSKDD